MTTVESHLHDIFDALNTGKTTIALSFVIFVGFDRLCDEGYLIRKILKKYGIRGVVADWFCSYLSNRFQFVQVRFMDKNSNVNYSKSDFVPINI